MEKTEQPEPSWRNLFDLELIEFVLHDTARARRALSYAETLDRLGYAFSRPKMRALCVALAEVDRRARLRGEPPLAVLVVRAADGLPGAGWWIAAERRRYRGPLEGPAALAYIKRRQGEAFRFWRTR